jgi:hypothetical protein
MRARAILALALLLTPAIVDAQRSGGIRLRPRGPGRAAPLPEKRPAIVAEAQSNAYRRMRISLESYPMVAHIVAPGFGDIATPNSWTTMGAGTRADYRVAKYLSATLDITETFFGGPANTESLELGFRVREPRLEQTRVMPFFDVRFGYMRAFDTYFRPGDIAANAGSDIGSRYGQGVGGVVGGGLEIALTRRFSATTAVSMINANMSSYDPYDFAPSNTRYNMTTYRYIIGLRFNPVRNVFTQAAMPAAQTQ